MPLSDDPSRRSLIINGQDADPDAFPYFAFIGWGGGALIAPDIVLTAGHCLPDDSKTLRKMKVQVGKYNRDDDRRQDKRQKDDDGRDNDDGDDGDTLEDDDDYSSSSSSVETFRVARAIRHPYFRIDSHARGEDVNRNDYLLLKLDGRSNAPVVSINRDPSIPRPGDALTVMGMGWIEPQWPDVFPKVLQTVQLDYLPNDQCARSHGHGMSYRHKIDESHMCTTGGPDNERDACAYDSGSPILWTNPKAPHHKQILVGTVSWGEECADKDFPGVNSRTSVGSDWIDAVVCEYSDDPPDDFQCSTYKKGSLVVFDQRHRHHPLEMLIIMVLMAASLGLVRWSRSKKAKKILAPINAKLGSFQSLSRHDSSYSYNSVGSSDEGVEIIT